MSNEHVEVLRNLSEVCRAAIKAGDWKVDGACDPDSLLRHADAAIASLSAPQPPAEAQRCTCPSGDGSLRWPCPAHPPEAQPVYVGVDLEGGWIRATTPPSAPVGVEGLRYDAGLLSDYGGGNIEWWQDYVRAELDRAHDFYTEALAQQPAADLAWCAMDRDECTVTLAFDTEEQVNKFISGHPSRKRTLVVNDFDCPHSAFDNCDCYADQQGGSDNG